jgi:stage II sporulation protein D
MSFKLKLLLYTLMATHAVMAQDVRIGVLGLFRARHLTLKASPTEALIILSGKKTFVLERSSGQDVARITVSGDELILQVGNESVRASNIHAASRSEGAADFVLAVPGKIHRQYYGVLELKAVSGVLVPVVRMDLETAVASVVQAESAPDTPVEALKAQAIATRSYFVASEGRHHDFDFCDTTHCQFLREPPTPGSSASLAASATRSMVLVYRDRAVAAMYTRSCGGHTRTPDELGMPTQDYPYFSVICDYYLRHPSRWSRRLSQTEAADLLQHGEASRLNIGRRLGWDMVPSNNFTTHREEHEVILEGEGQGHGIGLCQQGAKAMAQAGSDFGEILSHYYPNTTLARVARNLAVTRRQASMVR